MKNIVKNYYTDKQFTCLKKDINCFLEEFEGDGLLNVYTRHTTCAIKIIENEILLLADIHTTLDRIFPEGGRYMHDIIGIRDVPPTERINGYSHLRQLFLSTSETIPVLGGKIQLGKWQTPFLVELDPARDREVVFSLIESS